MNQRHWDKVYSEKSEEEVSWFQEQPTKSLELIGELSLQKDAPLMDCGGGDSRLVDHLLEDGFKDITVLDISSVSLEKLKQRLLPGPLQTIHYVASDVTTFRPTRKFALWHDRATFHFLITLEQIEKYLQIVDEALYPGGNLIISTFSSDGPDKCSGLPIQKYSDKDLKELFQCRFTNTKCFEDVHKTPWGTTQSFVYCGFKKK